MLDFVALLTGTTNKFALSATCDKSNTEILTEASTCNWSEHDCVDALGVSQPVGVAGCPQITSASLTIASGSANLGDNGKYYFNLTNSGATRTVQVFSDVAKTSLVASGSRSGDGSLYLLAQNSSGITGTVVVAYTADDTDNGNIFYSLCRILKQPLLDDGSKYMYVKLNFLPAGYVVAAMYETWNKTTHTGTNEADYGVLSAVGYSQRVNVSVGGMFLLSASMAHFGFISYHSGLWGPINYMGATIFTQRTRRSAYDTVANGYPPTVAMASFNNYCYASRISNAAGTADLTGQNCTLNVFAGPWPTSAVTPLTGPVIGSSDKTIRHLLLPLSFSQVSAAFLGGECSSLNNIWMTTYNYGGAGDELTVGLDTYVVWPMSNTYRIAVRKG